MRALTLIGAALAYSVVSSAGNPFEGMKQFVNPRYADDVGVAAQAFISAKKIDLAKKATQIQKNNPTWTWIDSSSKISQITEYLQIIKAGGDASVFGTFVIYNLPDRECGTTKPPGELSIAQDGVARYKAFIDSIKAAAGQFEVLQVFIIEPGSLANLVAFKDDPKCAAVDSVYKDLIKYAISALAFPNVNAALYLDGGDSATLGWDDKISIAAQTFWDIKKEVATTSLRGLAVNVGKYNAWNLLNCPDPKSANRNCDERRYMNSLATLLTQLGWSDIGFIIDSSRSGVPLSPGADFKHTCNLAGAGLGDFPGAPTNDPLADTFIWAAAPGRSDGTSDPTSENPDPNCNADGSFKDPILKTSPKYGDFFLAYFEQLIINANPPIVPST